MTLIDGSSSRLGCPPRWGTPRTPGRETLGPKVGAIASLLGMPPMPHQQHMYDVSMEIDPVTGELAYDRVIVVMGRQQGKTSWVLPKICHRCLGMAQRTPQHAIYTAQTADKARLKWRDTHIKLIKASPLANMIAHGSPRLRLNFEQLEWRNGSTYSPVTPSAATAGTGESTDEGELDEAWAHGWGVEQAMAPTQVTRVNSQFVILSTVKRQEKGPPDPTFAAYLRAKMAAGRAFVEAGVTSGTAYFEWSAPEGSDPLDPATWWDCLPAMGHTVTEKAMRAQLETLGLEDFCAEFLTMWPDETALKWLVIAEAQWRARADERRRPGYPVAFALDVNPERSMGCIAVAGPDDGAMCVEITGKGGVLDHRPGPPDWMVPRVKELVDEWRPCAVMIPRSSGAASLIKPLANVGVEVKVMSTAELAQAWGLFHDAAVGKRGTLAHSGRQGDLDASVAAGLKRRLGPQWIWDWASPGDVTPVQAATNAFYGATVYGPEFARRDYDVLKSIG